MTYKAPGKSYRNGMTLIEIMDRFPTELAAVKWFESALWPDQRKCGHCGGTKTRKASHKTMPTGARIAVSTSAFVPARCWPARM